MTVPMPAELAARLTVARAISADYARTARGDGPDARPDWFAWSARLHTALGSLVAALDALASGPGLTGGATIAPADVPIVLSALAIAARWDDLTAGAGEEHFAGPGQAVAFRALAYRLGGDL